MILDTFVFVRELWSRKWPLLIRHTDGSDVGMVFVWVVLLPRASGSELRAAFLQTKKVSVSLEGLWQVESR